MIQTTMYQVIEHFFVSGTCQTARGPARLHRLAEHSREQILQHDTEQQRGRETVEENWKKSRRNL